MLLAAPTIAQVTPFDGAWNVVMACMPHAEDDDDAKGYTHRFDATVIEGKFEGTHGTKGQPGWHFLHGKIHADGSATLRLDGVVNNPKYAIRNAPEGKPYTYRVKARFEGNIGIGERLTGRVCDFKFAR